MWQATYVAMVQPITGLSEFEILWDLPLCRGMAYFHAAMVKGGAECRWLDTQEDEDIKRARELIESKPWRR